MKICVEHFAAHAQGEVGGRAKAMIATRSRLHAVRYRRAVDTYLAERGYPFKALVAFSGTVQDGGQSYTESGMNGFPEAQTAKAFERPEYRFLIVANKFQTGFDQPLLHTMYVDQKVEHVIQEIVDSNFELYKRITFDRAFGESVKTFLFDQCLHAHRDAAELIKARDPKTQIVQDRTVCVVSCRRSPEPVFLKWKGMEAAPAGDFVVRSGPGTVKLAPDSAREYIRTRFPGVTGEGRTEGP